MSLTEQQIKTALAVAVDPNTGKDFVAGKALKKDVWIDGKCIGESAPDVFFYTEVEGGKNRRWHGRQPHKLVARAPAGPRMGPAGRPGWACYNARFTKNRHGPAGGPPRHCCTKWRDFPLFAHFLPI